MRHSLSEVEDNGWGGGGGTATSSQRLAEFHNFECNFLAITLQYWSRFHEALRLTKAGLSD